VLAQVNPLVGDVEGNVRLVAETLGRVGSERPDLVVFPELVLAGYPPRDLLERAWFVDRLEQGLDDVLRLSRSAPGTGILLGTVTRSTDDPRVLHNSAVLVQDGAELFRQAKRLLPTYDVFDETRYFRPVGASAVVEFKGARLGITVCEDAWNGPGGFDRRVYDADPVADLAAAGAGLLVNISASPFTVAKEEQRRSLFGHHARRHGLPLLFVNQVGGNDELVFDGRSMALDSRGRVVRSLPGFESAVAAVDTAAHAAEPEPAPMPRIESVYRALVLGLGDYVRKCGFTQVVLGLSGGIDSAVVACLAAAAVGPDNVLCITMPSRFSSRGSVEDSRALCRNLGVELLEIPIETVHAAYLELLEPHFAGRAQDEAEENIQARVRGNLVMAFSNKFGLLVLSTGNKSELAVGYCTLYGDMSGGLSVLADVPKTMVYELAGYINRAGELIPQSTIAKPPSAELRPGQADQDTLPPYPVLDRIIEGYVDEGAGIDELVASGLPEATVRWVVATINRNEYKRRQAAPGIKISAKAFGIGRRMPIAARY
jgi:NAD+ synthase (glutamine-hydrolysing)